MWANCMSVSLSAALEISGKHVQARKKTSFRTKVQHLIRSAVLSSNAIRFLLGNWWIYGLLYPIGGGGMGTWASYFMNLHNCYMVHGRQVLSSATNIRRTLKSVHYRVCYDTGSDMIPYVIRWQTDNLILPDVKLPSIITGCDAKFYTILRLYDVIGWCGWIRQG